MSKVAPLLRSGSSNADNATVFEIASNAENYDTWQLGSVGGAMDVFVSGDGTNFLTTAVALVDLGSTSPATAVIETTAQGNFGIRGRWKAIRVLQKGATAVSSAYLIGYVS
jgi:hypothetical protein